MGLREDILREPVTELDLRDIVALRRNTTIRDAVAAMREHDLGCAVVIDDDGRPLGKFTERQLIRVLLQHDDALDHRVSDHMASAWCCVATTDPIAKVIDCMKSKGLRFVIVLDAQGKAVGITGQKGVMEYIAEHFPRQIKVQRMSSKLSMDHREGA